MSNKKIVHYVTRQYMKKNKKRTFTTLFGIMCMVMLMTCVFVGKETAVKYLETLAEQDKGKWHLSVYDVTIEEYEALKKLENIEEMVVSAEYGYSEFAVSANDERPFLHLKAYEPAAFGWMNIHVEEGRLPENKNEIIINIEAVEDGADIQLGDTISVDCFKRYIAKEENDETNTVFPFYRFELKPGQRLEVPQNFPYFGETTESFYEEHEYTGRKNVYTVVGFIRKPAFENQAAAAYTAIGFLDETMIANAVFNVSMQFDLRMQDNFYEDVQNVVGYDNQVETNDMVLAFSGNTKDSTINLMVNVMSVFFVVLIIAASVILIHNVFNMSFEERSRYLGMLSSVGATGKQKRSSVYYEALALLVAALPMGFGIGLLVIKLGMYALKPYIDQLFGIFVDVKGDKIALELSVTGIILTMVFSVITVWFSAYLPARKISRIGSVECIRGTATRSKKKYTINKRVVQIFGAEGMLAGNSIGREKKKTRGIIAAVSVFMVILIVTTFCTAALDKMITCMVAEDGVVNLQFDFEYVAVTDWGSRTDAQYESLKEQLLADENIENVVETYIGMFCGSTMTDVLSNEFLAAEEKIMDAYGLSEAEKDEFRGYKTFTHVNFVGFDDETFAKLVEATGADKSIIQDDTIFPAIVVQEGEISTQNTIYEGEADFQLHEIKQMTSKQIGETFDVLVYNPMNDGTPEEYSMVMKVAGYAAKENISEYISFNGRDFWVITNAATMENVYHLMTKGTAEVSNIAKMMYIKFNNTVCTMYDTLSQMSLETMDDMENGVIVYNSAIVNRENIATVLNSAIRILLTCFVILTSIICLLNLYNSARGRIAGQKKEYAILRSMGMTDGQLHKMLVLECCSILTRSVFIAVLIATPVIAVLQVKLSQIYGAVTLPNPWWVYGVAIIIAVIALYSITFITFHVEKTENILEDIRREGV